MSTLISSAVSGKKAAPKAAPRRRPAQQPTPAKASTPISVSSTQTSVAPPSPPPTQQTQTPAPFQPVETPEPSQPADKVVPHPTADAQPQQPTPTPSEVQVTTPASTQTQIQPQPQPQAAADPDEELPDLPIFQLTQKRARDPAPAKETQPPAKRVKRSSARSNAQVQAQVNEEETLAAPVVASRASGKGKGRASEVHATPAATPSTANPAPQQTQTKRKRKPRFPGLVSESEAETEAGPVQQDVGPQETPNATEKPKRRRRGKKGQQTQLGGAVLPPESGDEGNGQGESEAQQETNADENGEEARLEPKKIDPSTVTMYEVSRRGQGPLAGMGQISEREKKMAEIDWAKVVTDRHEKLDAAKKDAEMKAARAAKSNRGIEPVPAAGVHESIEGPEGAADPTSPGPGPAPTGTVTADGVEYRIIDGQIVVVDESLVIDRSAQVQAEAQADTAEAQEEEPLTKRVNRMTHLEKRRRDPQDRFPTSNKVWKEEDTEKFYEALSMFGTDFYIISKMFPPKTRKQIKTKFIREERLDLKRINAALSGNLIGPTNPKASYDLNYYAEKTERDVSEFTRFDNVQHAERIIAADLVEQEERMHEVIREEDIAEQAKQQAQVMREKNRKGQAERREARAKEGGATKGRGRKKKGAAMLGGGGPAEAGGEAVAVAAAG